MGEAAGGVVSHHWDPQRYLTYADERGRPFVELLARVRATAPATVVDLGCGPGNLTALLAERWPDARISGIDSSPEMVAAAQETAADGGGIEYACRDLREWAAAVPARSVDVLVANAVLQWVPGHLDLLPQLVGAVAPEGWLAFQVPANFDQPSHTIRAELAAEAPYAEHTAGLQAPSSHDPAAYFAALARPGRDLDAWETTYLHVLHGPDPVFTWVSGTGARPTLEALDAADPALRLRFEEEFRRRLRAAYPDTGHGVVLPFRRVFVVAQLAAAPEQQA
jgi:trans-aconitate 2-methyltransferase